ncbi:MAG: HK97 family phage prohead protease [Proteobacteria bacterium]|nr:HK97 family phage prohead protease [Pseudomonadota bacterium]
MTTVVEVMERRVQETGKLELRKQKRSDDETSESQITIRGYAAVFNKLSFNLGGFREQIAPGAFDGVMNDDVRALFNHDPNFVLGRLCSGTLRLGQDATGLWYEVDLPDTQVAEDLAESIGRGDVTQSSFAFSVSYDGQSWDEDDEVGTVRTIVKISRLYDVSPVTYPAYPDSTIAKRSMNEWRSKSTAKQQHEAVASRKRQMKILGI